MQQIIETERLLLRPFNENDAEAVTAYARDYELYKTTLGLPHPYTRDSAEAWIETHQSAYEAGTQVHFAAVLKSDRTLIGAFSLIHKSPTGPAEIGYWVGRPHWGQGYAKEAARALIDYGFKVLEFNRIYGRYMVVNEASARVMKRCGMSHEGVLREMVYKDGYYHDIGYLGMNRSCWLRQSASAHPKLKIQKAVLEDAYALHYIQQKAFGDDVARYGGRDDSPVNDDVSSVKKQINAFDYYTILENKRVIGGAVIRLDDTGKLLTLMRLYIEPSYHNLGLGKQAVLQLETFYQHYCLWRLETPHKNYRNHYFYESLGYKKVGEKAVDNTMVLFEYEKITCEK